MGRELSLWDSLLQYVNQAEKERGTTIVEPIWSHRFGQRGQWLLGLSLVPCPTVYHQAPVSLN